VENSLEVELDKEDEDEEDVEYVSELESEEDDDEEVLEEVDEFENELENVAADKLLELEITGNFVSNLFPYCINLS
jgi:vacuolar-type H+-ATPase subunit I/STV1